MTAFGPVTTSVAQATASVRLRCWGDFALADCETGADLRPRGRKARALLAYLALHPGKPVSRERLTGLLWGDRAEEQARASLRQAILELKPVSNGGRNAVSIERDHLELKAAALVTDIEEMRAVAASANYEALLQMLPDPDDRLFANLDDVDEGFDEWLAIERSRQHATLIELIADASAAALANGQTRHARALHARLREFEPAAARLSGWQATGAAEAAPAPPLKPAAEPLSPHASARPRIVALCALLFLFAAMTGAGWFFMRTPTEQAPAIAVLPFKSSSPNNASFADGLSEEITTQLARQPGLRVAGRSSAAQFRDAPAGLVDIGRKLHVSYLLEGSVRSSGERIRVNVALTKASDGLQLWSQSFDGTLDDVLAIQYRIAASVAESLNVKLSRSRVPTGALATSGKVYSLYLSARGLIRERNSAAFGAAREKLLLATRLDPNFAPAWSSLAQAENPGGSGPDLPRLTARAIAHAEKALSLAPDLAEAHGVLGMLYGFEHPLGRQHIERAAELDPTNAEFQFWLGNVHSANGDFSQMLDAYRRAYALDPLWNYAQEHVVTAAWTMGYRGEALADERRVETDGSAYQAHLIRSVLAGARGDFSEQLGHLAAARDATSDPGRKASAQWWRAMVFEQLGLYRAAFEACRSAGATGRARPEVDPYVLIRQGKLPTYAELRQRNSNSRYSWEDTGYVARAAKQLIDRGRARDVVALYDSDGLLQFPPRSLSAPPTRMFEDGPIVAAALIAVGRRADAERLLAAIDDQIATALKRSGGRAPAAFFASAAQTWALRGKPGDALAALERALANGWLYRVDLDDSSLSDIGDEPGFRSLRGIPRFEAIRARINGQLARERREALAQIGRTSRQKAFNEILMSV
jgi:TolB-like protein/DNA-binding SARP family transcriptional activator